MITGLHAILFTDDADGTRELLGDTLGLEFTEEIVERPWGRSTTLELPGGGRLPLYEPSHPTPLAS